MELLAISGAQADIRFWSDDLMILVSALRTACGRVEADERFAFQDFAESDKGHPYIDCLIAALEAAAFASLAFETVKDPDAFTLQRLRASALDLPGSLGTPDEPQPQAPTDQQPPAEELAGSLGTPDEPQPQAPTDQQPPAEELADFA